MPQHEILEKALRRQLPALTEHDAKQLLCDHGIPVVDEQIALTPDDAAGIAERIGFPVVLKAMGVRLQHKTERGLVRLDITDADTLRQHARHLVEIAGEDLESLLVQKQVAGDRELVVGMFRDPQFGPVVMAGIGGIFTEALEDVAFRVAPVSRGDVDEMLAEIKAGRLLGAYRGMPAVNRDQLAHVVTAVGQLAETYPEIAEIDINPLIVTEKGDLVAVDALVTLGPPPTDDQPREPVSPAAIRALFYPRSIAFVGASAQLGKWGNMLFSNTASGGYQGDIFLINPKGGTIAGHHVYRRLSDLPVAPDLAVVTIPAANVMDLIPQMAEKGVRRMLLITSGFGETGPEGKALEANLVRMARESGILILGPNTMGICNPHIHLYCTGTPVQPLAGSTAMVAQSGNMGTQLLAFAEKQGIGIRAFCGSGNEAMITIEDYMTGFEVDDLTRIVMLYVESVKDGRRFFKSACRVSRKRPIVLLKGGQSDAGNRAAASHTGAMASDSRVFDAVCRQAGIVKVERPMDLLDLSAAFSSLPLPHGNRAAIMTLGGGWGVVTADLCAQFGIDVPPLPDNIISRIDDILPPYWSRANPVDIVGENDPSLPVTIMEELLKWDGCDGVINLGIMGRRIFAERMAASACKADPSCAPDLVEHIRQTLFDFERQYVRDIVTLMETYQKPVFGVSLLTDAHDQTVYRVADKALKAVFYETPERAVQSFSGMIAYHRYLERQRSC